LAAPEQVREPADAGRPARGALVDVGVASGDCLGVGPATLIAALGALGLARVDRVGQLCITAKELNHRCQNAPQRRKERKGKAKKYFQIYRRTTQGISVYIPAHPFAFLCVLLRLRGESRL
jgi:hypothetical protein